MLNRLNDLSFVIGIFFILVSIILLVNIFTRGLTDKLSIYSAAVFLIFGLAMVVGGNKKNPPKRVQ